MKKMNESVICECGCGNDLLKYDGRGRPRRFIYNHQNKNPNLNQRLASSNNLKTYIEAVGPWNKGKKYLNGEGRIYSTKASWRKATITYYGPKCSICGWSEASCDVHHRISKKEGGNNTIKNAIILCPNHHRLAHQNMLLLPKIIPSKAKYAGRPFA